MMRLAIILTAMIAAACPVGAATLSVANGNVLVNSGNGFKPATAGQALLAGDRVMIGAGGGSATITYDQACAVNVQVGNVATVKAGSPCASASAPPDTPLVAGVVAVAVGVGVAIYQVNKPSNIYQPTNASSP